MATSFLLRTPPLSWDVVHFQQRRRLEQSESVEVVPLPPFRGRPALVSNNRLLDGDANNFHGKDFERDEYGSTYVANPQLTAERTAERWRPSTMTPS